MGSSEPAHDVPKEHNVAGQKSIHERLVELFGSSIKVQILEQKEKQLKEPEDSSEVHTEDENGTSTTTGE